jgi:outer membrane protein assembly factor BamD
MNHRTFLVTVRNNTLSQFLRSTVVASALALTLTSCGSSQDASKTPGQLTSFENRFNEGKQAYEKGNYQEAIRIFEEIRIQAPTSDVAAEATYLEGMSRFQQESFSAAAVDFRATRRSYPMSAFAPRAQYMIAESYFRLSPRPELDQTYSTLAISEYQAFLRDYTSRGAASSSSVATTLLDSAQNRLTELRNKLGEKMFKTAELYTKMEEYKSALVYYDRVLEQYYDTPSAAEAQLRIAEVQYSRRKNAEAKAALTKFEDKFLLTAAEPLRVRARELKSRL